MIVNVLPNNTFFFPFVVVVFSSSIFLPLQHSHPHPKNILNNNPLSPHTSKIYIYIYIFFLNKIIQIGRIVNQNIGQTFIQTNQT